jgi:hypothetical protein
VPEPVVPRSVDVPDASDPAEPGRIAEIDPAAVQASFDRLSAIFGEMMVTVADISTRRCPYKDKTDHCTAKFGCRNQRRPTEPDGLQMCGGDDRLDYRGAWETT